MASNTFEVIFLFALIVNALLFLPQLIKLIKAKHSDGVSLTMFVGFLLIQLAIILHSIIKKDVILFIGVGLNFLTCLSIVIRIIMLKTKEKDSFYEKRT